MKVAVIGGGAAGFFAAISCKNHHPGAIVTLYEKSDKTLSKVKVSGGGRCNVTNGCESLSDFLRHYPRGQKQLKKTFNHFNRNDTIEWFESKGVELKVETDLRMFPITDDSQTIVDCLRDEVSRLEIDLKTKCGPVSIEANEDGFDLHFRQDESACFTHVILSTGGSPKSEGYNWIRDLGHQVVDPVPSLFTFNIPGEDKLKAMMGLAVPHAVVKIQGTKLLQEGPLLVTHWGLSGPAVLKLSAWGARQLAEVKYNFKVQVNWTGVNNEDVLREQLENFAQGQARKKISNAKPFDLPNRLWDYLLAKLEMNVNTVWSEIRKKDKNRLINALLNDEYKVEGKTTFKEEFVTCGGVDLAEVDFNTMESRKTPRLFFAGELLDIDGITGGFNFQAAWSTGFVAGKLGQ
ncbi:MAG: NAD(P)/FAD-dependent oxidoreductase [Reichenbachiella sp.]|uniref:NAD(P)/FAD-dependent oxidoreductase n=1 Tax=Reichenbachiella sp. TaxID=2184521 RepID=UPI003267416E